jgi:hypothetical protein
MYRNFSGTFESVPKVAIFSGQHNWESKGRHIPTCGKRLHQSPLVLNFSGQWILMSLYKDGTILKGMISFYSKLGENIL